MNVIYIQDQEIGHHNGKYYYSKSEHFFSRYLYGLKDEDTLTIYVGLVDIPEDSLAKYKDVSHPRINFKKLPDFRKLKNLPRVINQLCKIVKDADFCYLRTGVFSSFVSFACHKYNIPYMSIVNEDIYKNTKAHKSIKVRLTAYPLYWLNHKAILNANYACYVTQEYLQSQYPCRGKSIGCSDIEILDINPESLIKRIQKIEQEKVTMILGSVGSVSAVLKGQETVIRALALLKSKGVTNYEYHLVGTGDQNRLRNLALELGVAEKIKFLGEFSHDEVIKWFDNIDIYLHPSHSEGLPRTILEAMTRACPCICSSVGGIPELINKKFLFSYNGKEVSDVAKLICDMTKEVMKEEAKSNFEHSKNYNPEELERTRHSFFSTAIKLSRQLDK